MKKLIFLIPLFLLTACGGGGSDDGVEPSPTPTPTPGSSIVTNPYLTRMEMPMPNGGQSEVITHSTDAYGVNYSFEWDHSKRATRWVCYDLTEKNYPTNGNTRKNLWGDDAPWNYDPDIAASEQIAPYNELSQSYFPGTGDYYEKGHICPSADRLHSKDANEQTFYMTNIMPMVRKFNGGIWASMETQIRKWVGTFPNDNETNRKWNNFCDVLYVCKGGTIENNTVILDKKTKNSHIVPKYYFMALLAKKGDNYKALGFWVEHLNEDHSNDKLGEYVVSIDKLEELTGIDFFCNLPDDIEKDVESTPVNDIKSNWGL